MDAEDRLKQAAHNLRVRTDAAVKAAERGQQAAASAARSAAGEARKVTRGVRYWIYGILLYVLSRAEESSTVQGLASWGTIGGAAFHAWIQNPAVSSSPLYWAATAVAAVGVSATIKTVLPDRWRLGWAESLRAERARLSGYPTV